jgi:type 1 glutamine amidotransferase
MKCLLLASLCLIPLCLAAHATAADPLRVLIIDGQNNHAAWPKTTAMMRSYLEESGRFEVDVARTRYTWNGGDLLKEFPLDDGRVYEDLPQPKTDPNFKPNFSDYDVVLSNFGWNAAPWPPETQAALEAYVRGGGGLVIVHAADNSFADWLEFNKMIGLGGWGGRNEKSGPYLYLNDDGEVVRDMSPGSGGDHGPQHPYQIATRDPDHPITRGLPRTWMHAQDELYQKLRGPALNVDILATAYADEQFKGTGRHEPIMMTVRYGAGRVYHTPMGHDDNSMSCVGFITTLVRGTEWAATGEVTVTALPEDFPTPNEPRQRKFAQ